MGYMYAAIWFIAGLVLVFWLAKENKIFYLAGAFFFVLGGWWLADAIQPAWQVFQGVPGIVLKVIAGEQVEKNIPVPVELVTAGNA